MRMQDAARLSVSTLLRHPLRTLLTILGLGVGVAAVLTVITLGSAGQAQVEQEIARLGVDKVWLTPRQGSSAKLDSESAARLSQTIGTPVCSAAYAMLPVVAEENAFVVSAVGYDQGVEDVLAPVILQGRGFTGREYAGSAAVALVDENLSEALGGDVLHRRISLGGRLFTVVGVIRPLAVQASSGMAMLPLQTLMDTFPDAAISELTLNVPGDKTADAVAAMALDVLGGDYTAATLQEEIDAAKSVIRIFVLVLASVAAVCVLTGGIGVMNILLVSVRERRREIGLIKAVGGTSRQVAALFMLEAACYALLGGLLGLAAGIGLIALFGQIIGLCASLSAGAAVWTLLGAAGIGMLFGVAPALRASSMLPADALRQE